MRLVLELVTLFFVYLIVYRRVIEPFMEGLRNKKQVYNDPKVSENLKSKSATRHPSEIESNANIEIVDAEFQEIQPSDVTETHDKS